MTFEDFQKSLEAGVAPPRLPPLLQALWFDARGEWDKAHELAQADETRAGSRLHAYLHRKEGDLGNAEYWYRRAGAPRAEGSLSAEWASLCEAFLQQV